MKKLFRLLFLVAAMIMLFPLTQCTEEVIPPKPRDYLYGKFWYNDQGLGDYKFNMEAKTYEYVTPWGVNTTGTFIWYNDLVDSMKVIQTGGGYWTLWFREITEHQFTMSQSNENHSNIYTYKDTKP